MKTICLNRGENALSESEMKLVKGGGGGTPDENFDEDGNSAMGNCPREFCHLQPPCSTSGGVIGSCGWSILKIACYCKAG